MSVLKIRRYEGAFSSSTYTAQLRNEIDTDWFPDPWHWACLDHPEDKTYTTTIRVPFPGGVTRRVPVLTAHERAAFAGAALRVVSAAQKYLAPSVFGFRVGTDGLFEHYRYQLRQRADFESAAKSSNPFIAVADIQSFFPTLRVGHLEAVLTSRVEEQPLLRLTRILRRFREKFGYAFPEGHAASRAVASLALIEVDQSVRGPFTRWLDDYKIFSQSRETAASELGRLMKAIRAAGLEVSQRKTGVSDSVPWCYAASLGDHETDQVASLESALSGCKSSSVVCDEKRIRLALRVAAERDNSEDLETIVDAWRKVPPIAYPRLVWAMWRHRADERVWGLATDLLLRAEDLDEWKRLRVLPLLWYLPNEVTEAVQSVLVSSLSTDGPSRAVAARVAAKRYPDLALSFVSRLPDRESRLVLEEVRQAADPAPTQANLPGGIHAGPPIRSYL